MCPRAVLINVGRRLGTMKFEIFTSVHDVALYNRLVDLILNFENDNFIIHVDQSTLYTSEVSYTVYSSLKLGLLKAITSQL